MFIVEDCMLLSLYLFTFVVGLLIQTKILPNTEASFELMADMVAVLEASYVNCVGEVSVFPYCTPVTATLAAEDYNRNYININNQSAGTER